MDAASAFPRIVREHQDRVFSLALRLCSGDPLAAEELAHTVFVKAYRAFVTYDDERRRSVALRPWLATIALNEARNASRAAARRRDHVSRDGDVADRVDATAVLPEDAALRADRRAELAAALDALPGPQRDAVVLRHVSGLSYAEVGEVLAKPVGTVKSDVHRALIALRELIKENET